MALATTVPGIGCAIWIVGKVVSTENVLSAMASLPATSWIRTTKRWLPSASGPNQPLAPPGTGVSVTGAPSTSAARVSTASACASWYWTVTSTSGLPWREPGTG